MAATITHATVVGQPDDGSPVGSSAWNANHVVSGVRDILTANRTYYIRTNGSDSNNGLANTAGGAWLTVQHAWDWICANLDFAGYSVTVQIADGTYQHDGLTDVNSGVLRAILSQWVGGGSLVFQGNSSDREAVIWEQLSSDSIVAMIACFGDGTLTLKDILLKTPNLSNINMFETNGTMQVFLENVGFQGGTAGSNILCGFFAYLYIRGTYTVHSSNAIHIQCQQYGQVEFNASIVASGAVDSGSWFWCANQGYINIVQVVKTGTFTGFTAYAGAGGLISAAGNTISQMPGDGTYLGELGGVVSTVTEYSALARPTAIDVGGSVSDTTITRHSSGTIAIEGVPVVSAGITVEPTSTRTLALADAAKRLEFTNTTNAVVTIPPTTGVAFPTGSWVEIVRKSTGTVALTTGAGVTLNSITDRRLISAQWGVATVYKTSDNAWIAYGDLSS